MTVEGEEGERDGEKRTSNNGNRVLGGTSGVLDRLSAHGGRTHDVEGRDAEQALGVKSSGVLEHFGRDRDGRVDRVGDDADEPGGLRRGEGELEVSERVRKSNPARAPTPSGR